MEAEALEHLPNALKGHHSTTEVEQSAVVEQLYAQIGQLKVENYF